MYNTVLSWRVDVLYLLPYWNLKREREKMVGGMVSIRVFSVYFYWFGLLFVYMYLPVYDRYDP